MFRVPLHTASITIPPPHASHAAHTVSCCVWHPIRAYSPLLHVEHGEHSVSLSWLHPLDWNLPASQLEHGATTASWVAVQGRTVYSH